MDASQSPVTSCVGKVSCGEAKNKLEDNDRQKELERQRAQGAIPKHRPVPLRPVRQDDEGNV